jgi:hypothetical protein
MVSDLRRSIRMVNCNLARALRDTLAGRCPIPTTGRLSLGREFIVPVGGRYSAVHEDVASSVDSSSRRGSSSTPSLGVSARWAYAKCAVSRLLGRARPVMQKRGFFSGDTCNFAVIDLKATLLIGEFRCTPLPVRFAVCMRRRESMGTSTTSNAISAKACTSIAVSYGLLRSWTITTPCWGPHGSCKTSTAGT